MEIKLVKTRQDYLDLFIAFSIAKTTGDYDLEDYYDAIQAFWWILKVDNNIAGFASLQIGGEYGNLTRVVIFSKYRGNKYQQELIKTREDFAKLCGCKILRAGTTDTNIASQKNLLACGFTEYSGYDGWGDPERTDLKYFRKFI